MRQAVERQTRGAPTSITESLPAPIDGINARDALELMKPTDAIELENIFPTPTDVGLRNGRADHSTFTGQCETVVPYVGLTATSIFSAVVNGGTRSLFNSTGAGAVGAAVVGGAGATVQALTNTRFDYAQLTTTGGSFLSLVNGADPALEYDGTTWSAASLTHANLASTDLLFTIGVYGGRFWYGRRNTFTVYYTALNSKSGALTELPLGSLFKMGGSLNSIITLTDATNNVADYIGFVSTEGEIVAFTGEVSVAAEWMRAAQFAVGRPVCKGNRAWTKYGTDALLLCADGVLPLRSALAADDRNRALTISDRIGPLVNTDVQLHGTRYGWCVASHPTNSKILVNVPTLENSTARQWVMNTRHKRWCKFTGWNAFSMAVVRDQLYIGMNGRVAKADNYEYTSDAGASIMGASKQSFNYFGRRGQTKLAAMFRPTFSIDGSLQISVGCDVDFAEKAMPPMQVLSGVTGDPFAGLWDAAWGGALTVQQPWLSLTGEGFCFAPRVNVSSGDAHWRWSASKLVYQPSRGAGL